MSTTKERIIELLESHGKTISTFFPSIGLSYSNFKGPQLKSSPSADILVKIKAAFPNVNIDWLLTGEGEMLKGDVVPQQPETNPKIDMTAEEFIKELERRDKQIEELLSQNSKLLQMLSNAQDRHARIEEKYLRLIEKENE